MHLNFMVVDDSPLQRQFAVDKCMQWGAHSVMEAGNGQEALRLLCAQTSAPDVILCDLEMPGMDGVVLMQELSRRGIPAHLVIVSSRETSLLSTVEAMAEAAGNPVLGVLQKPISSDSLKEVLEKLKSFEKKPAPAEATLECTEAEIREALKERHFINYYQPKIEIKTGLVKGVECLVRWQHPKKGLIMPGVFIAQAERCGLIDAITEQVFACALVDGRRWRDHGLDFTLAVNLSARSLADQTLADKLLSNVKAHGLSASDFILEITETAATEDISNALGTLVRLRLCGFGLSLDDYGTGQSSMQRIKTMPFTELKIDRSFVHRASKIKTARVILEHAIAIAKELNLQTVAEGVETKEDLDLLETLECDVAQGYFFSRPLSPVAFNQWIATRMKVDNHAGRT